MKIHSLIISLEHKESRDDQFNYPPVGDMSGKRQTHEWTSNQSFGYKIKPSERIVEFYFISNYMKCIIIP